MSVGKGLFAALAVAMSARREDLARNTAYMYVAAFYVGVMMRQLQEEVGGALTKCTNRNFALLLVNVPIFTLRKLVEQVNIGRGVVEFSSLRPHSEIELSRVLSSRSAVVCGHPLRPPAARHCAHALRGLRTA
ncbi:hypothetical protein STCU_10781 [Strigomonas culicis]|uniref:Starter acyltransferase (SAT) domain-containing protein n=1 Tax=Strigomonas culicis TaxID=28005 RepID=S9TGL9_9TRYP|nr:hypothetical protein STCU_10781 [Strigomonas culicis]|eukprot:EPY17177.1 hypothetical protein STCU_10781 [Strigomonas culicis]